MFVVMRQPAPALAARTVAEWIDRACHAGPVQGAARVGEASADGRLVRIGLFPDGRARFRATSCASLLAYAEAACEALEAGVPPSRLDEAALRARVAGVHPSHHERAGLVADALARLTTPERP
jgi:hypothetical protein